MKPESHISCSRECRKVWGNEPPHSKVSSHFGNWTLECLQSNCRGQNPLNWGVPYIIEKLLECKCLKWVAWPIWILKTQVMAKRRGRESNWEFDSRPLKVENCPDFLACRWRATYRWNFFDKGSNFVSDLILIEGLYTKSWASKVAGILILGISWLQLGSLGTKWQLGVSPMARHKEYYKGESDGFPQVRALVNLVNLCLPMARSCTKSVPTTH
jgi:hypothetical protein